MTDPKTLMPSRSEGAVVLAQPKPKNKPPVRTGSWVDGPGQRFGKLVTLAEPSYMNGRGRYVKCQCECGRLTSPAVHNLQAGRTRSCGCTQNRGRFIHGGSRFPEHRVWNEMLQRCNNPNDSSYRNYGARGIKVDPRWTEFANFIADMGRRPSSKHTIERKDNGKGYGPGNCIWATYTQQARNKRNQKRYTAQGQTLLLSEWAELANLDVRQIWARIHVLGWPVEKAVATPNKSYFYDRGPLAEPEKEDQP